MPEKLMASIWSHPKKIQGVLDQKVVGLEWDSNLELWKLCAAMLTSCRARVE